MMNMRHHICQITRTCPIPGKPRIGIVSTDKIGTIICSHLVYISGGEANWHSGCGALDCDLYHGPSIISDINLLYTVATANRYGSISCQADRSLLLIFHNEVGWGKLICHNWVGNISHRSIKCTLRPLALKQHHCC